MGANTEDSPAEKCPYSKKIKSSAAFTLIELVLYVGIMSVILIMTSISIDTLTRSGTKSRTVTEVEQQGLLAMEAIMRSTRNANSINSPTAGTNSSVISLAADAPSNPTIVRVSNGIIEMKEGAGDYVALTNGRIDVSGFTAQNLSRPGTPGAIRFVFTATYKSDSSQGEYGYAKTFSGSANIRTQ